MNTSESSGFDAAKWLRLVVMAGFALVTLALFPYTPKPALDIKYLLLFLAALAAAILWVVTMYQRVDVRLGFSPLTGFVVAFLAIHLLAALASDHRGNSLYTMGIWISLCVLYGAASSAFTEPRHAWRFLAFECVVVALSSLYGLFQKLGMDPFPWAQRDVAEYLNVPATFGNPNMAGHALALLLIASVGLVLRKGTRWCIVPAALMLLHLYWTKMRGAPLAMLVACAVVLAAMHLRKKGAKPFKGVVFSGAAGILVLVLGGLAAMGVAHVRTGSVLPVDGPVLLRYHAYHGASRMILDRPLLGYGPGNYKLENPRYWTPFEKRWFATERRMNYRVHNDFLEAGVEAGFPGMAAYAGLLAALFATGLSLYFSSSDGDKRRLGLVFAACAVCFSVDGLFGFPARVPVSAALLMLIAGLAAGVTRPISPRPEQGVPWRVLIPAAAAVAMLVLAAVGARVFTGRVLLQRGNAARAWEAYDVAQSYFDRSAAYTPWDWDAPRESGAMLVNTGKPRDAVPRLARAVANNPTDVMAWIWLARAHLGVYTAALKAQTGSQPPQESLDRAQECCDAAVRLCEDVPDAHDLLSRINVMRAGQAAAVGDDAAAQAAWESVVHHAEQALVFGYSDRASVLRRQAAAHQSLGDLDAAEDAFRRALECAPGDTGTLTVFAEFAERFDRRTAFTRALRTQINREETAENPDPDALATLLLRLADMQREREPEEALGALKRAVEAAPGRLDVWGYVFKAGGREAAVAMARERLALMGEEDAGGGMEALKSLVALLGDPEADVPACVEAISKHCEVRVQQTSLKAANFELGWMAETVESALKDAPMPDPAKAAAYYNLGVMYGVLKRFDDSQRTLAAALPLASGAEQLHFACLVQRANVLKHLARYDEALRLLAQADALLPMNIQIMHLQAKTLAAAGRLDGALKAYDMLLGHPDITPEERQGYLQERDALMKEGQ